MEPIKLSQLTQTDATLSDPKTDSIDTPANDDPKPISLSKLTGSTPTEPLSRASGLDPREFQDYMVGVDERVGDIYDRRAKGQGFGEELLGGAVQFGGEALGGTIEALGYIGEIPSIMEYFNGTEQEIGNFITEFGSGIREGAREIAPVYVQNENQKALNLLSSEWWFSNGGSVGSAISFLLPGAVAAKGAGAATKALGKGLKSAALSGKTATRSAEVLGATLISRHAENAMEASGVFEEQTIKYINDGLSGEEAKLKAAEDASKAYRWGYVNTLLDLPQFGLIFKGANFANNALKSRLSDVTFGKDSNFLNNLRKVKDGKFNALAFAQSGSSKLEGWKEAAIAMGSEGLEEIIQGVISEEAKVSDPDKGFFQRLDDYIKDPAILDAGFFGAFGGGVFHGAGRFLESRRENRANDEEALQIQNFIDRSDKVNRNLKSLTAASIKGDKEAYKNQLHDTIVDIGLNAASKGDIGYEKAMFETVLQMDDEQLNELGFSRETAAEGLALLNQVEATYNKVADFNFNVGKENQPLIPALANTIARLELALQQEDPSNLDAEALEKYNAEKLEAVEELNKLYNDPETQNKFFEDLKGVVKTKLEEADKARVKEKSEEVKQEVAQKIEEGPKVPDSIQMADSFEEQEIAFEDLDPAIQKRLLEQGYKPETGKTEVVQEEIAVEKPAEEKTIAEKANDLIEELGIESILFGEPPSTKEELESLVGRDDEFEIDPAENITLNYTAEEIDEINNQTSQIISDDNYIQDSFSETVPVKKEEVEIEEPKKLDQKEILKRNKEIQKKFFEREGEILPQSELEDAAEYLKNNAVIPTNDSVQNAALTIQNTADAKKTDQEPPVNEQVVDRATQDLNEKQEFQNSFLHKAAYRSLSYDNRYKNIDPSVLAFEDPNFDLEGMEIFFDINWDYIQGLDDYPADVKKALEKREKIVLVDGEYQFESGVSIDMDDLHMMFKSRNRIYNAPWGVSTSIQGYLHTSSFQSGFDISKQDRNNYNNWKMYVYNNIASGLNPTSKITHRDYSEVVQDPNNPNNDPDKAAKTNVQELLDQIKEKDGRLGFGGDTGDVVDSTGEILAPYTPDVKRKGGIYVILTKPEGIPYPHKLNTRYLNIAEAELVLDIYQRLMSGSKFSDTLNHPSAKGMSIAEALSLLVYEGDQTDRYIGGENHARLLKLQGGKLYVGEDTYTKEDLENPEIRKTIISHLKDNMRHNFVAKNLGDGDQIRNVKSTEIEWFGNKINTEEDGSYRSFLFTGDNPILTSDIPLEYEGSTYDKKSPVKIHSAFTQTAVFFDTNIDVPIVEEVEVENDIQDDIVEDIEKSDVSLDPESLFRRAKLPLREYEAIDAELEKAWIREKLSDDISIRLADQLIDIKDRLGEKAFGAFKNGIITLSKVGEAGTGYHEAFHAVFRTYLKDNEIEAILAEARELYPNLSDLDIEERLAEDFRAFVISEGKTKNPTKIQRFFKRLREIIKRFFGKPSTINDLFENINSGYYRNAKPVDKTVQKFFNDTAYKADGFSQTDFNEVVDFLAYVLVQKADIKQINDVKNIDVEKLPEYITQMRQHAIDKNQADLIHKWSKVLDNIDDFKTGIDAWFSSIGINVVTQVNDSGEVTNDSDQETIENLSAGLNIRNHYEFSGKDSASALAKLLIATQPAMEYNENGEAQYIRSDYLGLPKLVDYASFWNTIETALVNLPSGEFDGEYRSSFDQMRSKLEELSSANANVNRLYQQLMDLSIHRQKQFFSAFNNASMNFVSSTWNRQKKNDPVDGGTYSVIEGRVVASQAFSAKNRLVEEWTNNFLNGEIFEEDGINLNKFRKKAQEFKELQNAVKKDQSLDNHYEDLIALLDYVGITVDRKAIDSYVKSLKSSNPEIKFLSEISRVFSIDKAKKGSIAYIADKKLTPQEIIDGEVKPFTQDLRELRKLAEYYVITHPNYMDSESTVLARGKTFYIRSRPNLIHDTVNLIKNGSQLLNKIGTTITSKGSIWLKHFKSENNRDSFNYVTINEHQQQGRLGKHWKELKLPDRIFAAINSALGDGIYLTLNMSDKKTLNGFKGLPLYQHSVSVDKKGKVKKINKNVVNVITDYVVAEHARMRRVWEQVHGENPIPVDEQIEYLHGSQGLQFTNFPTLSYENLSDNKELRDILYEGPNQPSAVLPGNINEILAPEVTKILKEEVEASIQMIKRNGFFKIDKNGELKPYAQLLRSRIQGKYKNEHGSLIEGVLAAIGDFAVNSLIANTEQMKVLHGDSGAYKSNSDLRKRTSGINAAGLNLDVDGKHVRHHFNVAVLKDIEGSKYAESIEKTFAELLGDPKKAKELAKPYYSTNKADAQGYITLERFKEIQVGLGRWSKSKEKAYQDLLEGKRIDANAMKFFATPLKGVHFELQNHHGILVPVYLKYSQSVLVPSFIKDTDLEKLRDKMREAGVDEAIFESGVKLGARGKRKLDDADLVPIRLSNNSWRLQMETPTHGIEQRLMGAQMKRLGTVNLENDVKYGKYTGRELRARVLKIFKTLSNRGKENLIKRFGVDPETMIVQDANLVRSQIIDEIGRRGLNQSLLNYLEVDSATNQFKIPFDASPYSESIQNILFSIISRETVRFDALGGSFVQVSGVGLNKDLKPPRWENGEWKPGQIMLPSWFKKHLKNADQLPAEELNNLVKNAPGLLDVLIYRIPSQSKASLDVVEVVGFLPDEMGDSIITYDEITARTGADFDIDKIYAVLSEYEVKNGKLQRVQFDESKPFEKQSKPALTNHLIDLYKDIYSSPESYVEVNTPIDAISLKPLADDLKGPRDVESTRSMSEMSWTTQVKNERVFHDGAALRGLVVNAQGGHSIAQEASLASKKLRGAPASPQDKKLSDLSGMVDAEGDKIIEILGAMVNGTVDVTKDPYLSSMNVNTYTINVILAMIRAGAGKKKTFAFIKQPILQELYEIVSIAESETVFYDKKPIAVIREAYSKAFSKANDNRDYSQVEKSRYSFSRLKENIKNPNKQDPEFLKHQLLILDAFEHNLTIAKSVARSVIATKTDTVGSGKNIAEANSMVNRQSAVIADKLLEGQVNLLYDTILKTYDENALAIITSDNTILKNLFAQVSRSFRSIYRSIAQETGNFGGIENTDEINKIARESIAYLLSDSPIAVDQKELKTMITGDKSMANRLKRLKKHRGNNYLVSFLTYEFGEDNVHWVKGNPNKLNNYRINQLYDAWLELFNDPKSRDFAVDLAKYSYATSGWYKGLYTFHELIPKEILQEIKLIDWFKNLKFNRFNTIDNDTYMSEFYHQYFMANPDSILIPPVKEEDVEKKFSSGGETVGFRLNVEPESPYIAGGDDAKRPVFKPFVKLNDQLFQLVGYYNGLPTYKVSNTLNIKEKGKRIYEYSFDNNKARSIFKRNHKPSPKLEVNEMRMLVSPNYVIDIDSIEDTQENMDKMLESKCIK